MIEIKGQGQNGLIGQALEPLQVRVTDENGEPRAFLAAEYALVEGSGRFDFADDKTDIQGNAVAEFVPEGLGPYRIECRLDGGRLEPAIFAGQIAAEPAAKTATAAPEPPKAPDCCAKRGCLTGKAAPCGKCPKAAEPAPAVPVGKDPVPSLEELIKLHRPADPPKPAHPEWNALGVPDAMVAEHEAAAASGFVLTDPPPSVQEGFERIETGAPEVAVQNGLRQPEDKIPRSRGRVWLAAGMILGLLALTGLLVASLAKANEPPVTGASAAEVNCSGQRPKIVGNSFVYENCAVKR